MTTSTPTTTPSGLGWPEEPTEQAGDGAGPTAGAPSGLGWPEDGTAPAPAEAPDQEDAG